MKKNKLVRGSVKRVIAVATACMLTCNANAGVIGNTITAYADETVETNEAESNEISEDIDDSEKSEDIVDSDKSEDIVDSDESEDIVGSDESDDIVGSDESEDIVGSDESEDIVGSDESEDIVGSDESEDIVGSDESEDIVDSDKSEENVVGDLYANDSIEPAEEVDLMDISNEDSWYLTGIAPEEDGYYYFTPEGGEKTKITKQYIQVLDGIIYVGEDGEKVYKKWLENANGFRYVNSEGYVQINKEKMAAGFYGTFDGEGYWTAIEYQFFTQDLEDGSEVEMYSAKDGQVCKIASRYCYYKTDLSGNKLCYLIHEGTDYATDEPVTSAWTGDLYIDENGAVTVDQEMLEINGCYYTFDNEGHSELITNSIIVIDKETGDKIYVGDDGTMAKNKFVFDAASGHTIYFGDDGAQVFRQWIEDDNGFRYLNSNGYMLINSIKVVAGFYGSFAQDGYWTALENQFFIDKLEDGTEVQKYSAAEGKVAKNAADRYYYFLEKEGNIYCYLMGSDGETITNDAVENEWIGTMRSNAQGYLICNSVEQVGDIYYTFDKDCLGDLISYPISYELGGGVNNAANPAEYTGTTAKVTLASPSRTGYSFAGWYNDSSFTTRITELTSKNNDSKVILYAKWTKNESGGGRDKDSSSSGSSSSTTNTPPANTVAVSTTDGSSINSAKEGQSVAVSTGQTTVAAAVTQTTAGSVNGNTIVSTTTPTSVTVAEGQTAGVATIAVGKDGTTRSLLAASFEGAVVKQTIITVQGITMTQNVVAYADGTQVSQKSGTAEMSGFAETVVAAEQAIQSGKSIAEIYNGKVELNLEQYAQVGAAVTYDVVAGVNGAVPQTQMEQTSFTAGQNLVALITDVNGNVTATTIVVGNGGIVKYQIPGVNCIVRFLQPAQAAN